MKMKDLFLSEKKMKNWDVKPYEKIERTLFRWEIIVRSKKWKWMNSFNNWFEYRRTNESNSDDTRPDAFADEKNFLLMMQLMLSFVRKPCESI